MVQAERGLLRIDGSPRLVLAAEIHYFRLRREEWEDRIQKAIGCGVNCISSYIPWLVHEEVRGEVDLNGTKRPENDLIGFLDLCRNNGLWFFARPGPFVMAEMKNEGIPYWVYEACPEALPVSWHGSRCSTKTLDYLSPSFLECVREWYARVIPLLAHRTQPKGGPVIGLQLDNEIGMLEWVANEPTMTDAALDGFWDWLARTYRLEGSFEAAYPGLELRELKPAAFRSPEPEWQARLQLDFGSFQRERYRDYVGALAHMAREFGLSDVPLAINLHGTGGGRATTFPVALHQLVSAWRENEVLAGTDHYLGEADRKTLPDLYMVNAMMRAVGKPGAPGCSLEFEVGTGDYGDSGDTRQSSASAALKARLSVAQGDRLLNYYLFCGGTNPLLERAVEDGNARVAFTGGRHGFAAPISPEGMLDPTYFGLQTVTRELLSEPELAEAEEEFDDLALAFSLDDYRTDFRTPGAGQEMVRDLEFSRGARETLARALLLGGFRFPAVELSLWKRWKRPEALIAIAPSRRMDRELQMELDAHLALGGRLLVFGHVPTLDLLGRPCTVLLEALGATLGPEKVANPNFHLSVAGEGVWLDRPEIRVSRCQTFEAFTGDPLLRVARSQEVCGFTTSGGRVAVVATDMPSHVGAFRSLLASMGLKPAFTHDDETNGTIVLSGLCPSGTRFIHVLNADPEAKTVRVREHGVSLHSFDLGPKAGVLCRIDASGVRLPASSMSQLERGSA